MNPTLRPTLGATLQPTFGGTGVDETLRISVDNAPSQVEGVGNQSTFRIRATQPLTDQATVTWETVDGSALAGLDYTKVNPTTAIIPVNPGYVDVTVDLLGPIAGWAPPRGFGVALSNPGGNVGGDLPVLGRSTATGVITDSSAEPTVAITARGAPDPVEQNDTNPGIQTHTVTLTGITTHDVTILHDTRNGSATAGNDYTAIVGGSATVPAGQTSADIDVTILAGATVMAVENYFVDLGDVTTNGYSLSKTNSTGEGRIKEQDYLPAPQNLVVSTGGSAGQIDLTWQRGTV